MSMSPLGPPEGTARRHSTLRAACAIALASVIVLRTLGGCALSPTLATPPEFPPLADIGNRCSSITGIYENVGTRQARTEAVEAMLDRLLVRDWDEVPATRIVITLPAGAHATDSSLALVVQRYVAELAKPPIVLNLSCVDGWLVRNELVGHSGQADGAIGYMRGIRAENQMRFRRATDGSLIVARSFVSTEAAVVGLVLPIYYERYEGTDWYRFLSVDTN